MHSVKLNKIFLNYTINVKTNNNNASSKSLK